MASTALKITRKTDYALRAMICLAQQPRDALINFESIALEYDIPKDFLAKIMRVLVRGDLVESVRGARGGYRLARSATEISFLDVLEGIEGPVALNDCLDPSLAGQHACTQQASCAMVSVWRRAQDAMLEVLRGTSLADVAKFDCVIHQIPTLAGLQRESNSSESAEV